MWITYDKHVSYYTENYRVNDYTNIKIYQMDKDIFNLIIIKKNYQNK